MKRTTLLALLSLCALGARALAEAEISDETSPEGADHRRTITVIEREDLSASILPGFLRIAAVRKRAVAPPPGRIDWPYARGMRRRTQDPVVIHLPVRDVREVEETEEEVRVWWNPVTEPGRVTDTVLIVPQRVLPAVEFLELLTRIRKTE